MNDTAPNPFVFWDIDGTILINDLPAPNWDDPAATHPITGENVCGPMPVYWSHNHLNPNLTPANCTAIQRIITARPDYRMQMTCDELARVGIQPIGLWMFPGTEIYTRDKNLQYKATYLDLMDAEFYIDEDPDYRGKLQQILRRQGSPCHCISIAEWKNTRQHIPGTPK